MIKVIFVQPSPQHIRKVVRHRLKLRQILSEKWKEALQAVLPIITIVLALSFTIAPLSPSVLL